MLALITSLIVTLSTSCGGDVVISPSQLPAPAIEFITTYFPEDPILSAKKDREGFSIEYEVCLSTGTEITFDKHGNWTKVDCERINLPVAIIPAAILDYIRSNFPNNPATEISKEYRGYEVGLWGDIDLVFDTKGKFLRFDD